MKIRITPGAILFLLLLFRAKTLLLPATLLCAALHECGHLLAARLLGIRLRLLELDVPGARLVPRAALPSYRAEGLLAAAGPLTSLLLALLALPHAASTLGGAILAAALSQALFNLLPIRGFDGGRVLHALLCPRLGQIAAGRALALSSYAAILLLFSLASCLLLRLGASFMLALLCASLFAKVFLIEPCE